jgi:hypothetical protein
MTTTTFFTPKSVQVEHDDIHKELTAALAHPGTVGRAAKAVADALHSHFQREEEIALPPLAFLAPLAAGEMPLSADDVLEMTDALKSELPGMLEEHTRIHAAVNQLRKAARDEGLPQFVRLADQLALHAQTEEEVLYPAAILVGEIIRSRRNAGK